MKNIVRRMIRQVTDWGKNCKTYRMGAVIQNLQKLLKREKKEAD